MKIGETAKERQIHIGAIVLLSLSAVALGGCGGGSNEEHSEAIQTSTIDVNTPVVSTIAESPPPAVAPPPVAIPTPAVKFSGYIVTGNTIYDKSTGQAHLFRGVASPSMGWQVKCDHCTVADFQLMSQGWKANVVRLSVNQSFWLTGSAQYNAGYAAELARVVAAIEKAGMDVILDLHGSSSRYMADANSVVFWREVATAYRNNPRVLFELFNEPNRISWDVWLNGGSAPTGPAVHGMQELYNTVRATGATNLVVIGGLNWAYDLSGVPTHRVVGNNIVYNTHPYNYPGKQPADWDQDFGFLTKTDPVIATEFGNYDCTKGYYQAFVDYAKAHRMSWAAWGWFPGGCGFPAIVSDWMGTPNAPGEVVKAALLNP
ncbi:MAG: cellulase family glycosylhydrolase [Rhodoferax sp.]|nr:cellulase family glycosylhydrolase [Rhodoferax sp.]